MQIVLILVFCLLKLEKFNCNRNRIKHKIKIRRAKQDISSQTKDIPKIPTTEEIEALTKVALEGWISISSPSFTPDRYKDIKNGDQERTIELVEKEDIEGKEGEEGGENKEESKLHEGFRKNIAFGTEGSTVPALDQFYFRLSENNIYYTKDEKDLVVLGAINVKNVVNLVNQTKIGENCFKVFDEEKDEWELCTESPDVKKEWYCKLKQILKQDCEEKEQNVTVVDQIKEEVILLQIPSRFCNENWNYQKHGADWECNCVEGLKQSPIDLNPNQTCNPYDVAPQTKFDFKPMKSSDWSFIYKDNLIQIICEASDCSTVSFGTIQMQNGAELEGKYIQFHTPSDHQIGGKRYDLEVQAYFESKGPGAMQRAVLSFLFEEQSGKINDFINSLDLTRIPNVVKKQYTFLAQGVDSAVLSDMWVNKEESLTYNGDFSFFYYQGSLTIPQCEENVHWFVVADPLPIGKAWLTMLKSALTDVPELTSDSTPDYTYQNLNNLGTYRVLQQLNGRQVSFHKNCNAAATQNKNSDYHFEMVENSNDYYYYTLDPKGSGITGAKQMTQIEMINFLKEQQLKDKVQQNKKNYNKKKK